MTSARAALGSSTHAAAIAPSARYVFLGLPGINERPECFDIVVERLELRPAVVGGRIHGETHAAQLAIRDLFNLAQNGINLVQVKQTLSAEPATVSVAAALDVVPGAALLSLTRRSFDESGQLVDVLHGLYNPKRFKYLIELSLE